MLETQKLITKCVWKKQEMYNRPFETQTYRKCMFWKAKILYDLSLEAQTCHLLIETQF